MKFRHYYLAFLYVTYRIVVDTNIRRRDEEECERTNQESEDFRHGNDVS